MYIIVVYIVLFFFFNDTATTEIYTYLHIVPYTTLFRSGLSDLRADRAHGAPGNTDGVGVVHAGQAPPTGTLASRRVGATRSEEHTSELQSLMRISYAVFCLKKNN